MVKEGITHYRDYTIFKHEDREYIIWNKNETKEDGTSLFTFNEAIEHCNKLQDRYIPSCRDWINLVCDWCRYYGFELQQFPSYVEAYRIGDKFSEDFYLPLPGYIPEVSDTKYNAGIKGYYRSETIYMHSEFSTYNRILMFSEDWIDSDYLINNEHKLALRCFKPITGDYFFIQ